MAFWWLQLSEQRPELHRAGSLCAPNQRFEPCMLRCQFQSSSRVCCSWEFKQRPPRATPLTCMFAAQTPEFDDLEADAEANRQAKPDDARAISFVTAVRSMLATQRKLDAGSLEDVDVQLAMRLLRIFVATLRAWRGEPG